MCVIVAAIRVRVIPLATHVFDFGSRKNDTTAARNFPVCMRTVLAHSDNILHPSNLIFANRSLSSGEPVGLLALGRGEIKRLSVARRF